MRPNPHVPLFQFYDCQKLEEIIRRRDVVQHAAKILHPRDKEPEHVQLRG